MRRLALLSIVVALAVGYFAACSNSELDIVLDAAPGLPPEAARLLLESDGAELAHRCDEVEYPVLMSWFDDLQGLWGIESFDDFASAWPVVKESRLRLARELARRFEMRHILAQSEAWHRLPLDEAYAFFARTRELREMEAEDAGPWEPKLERWLEAARDFRAAGFVRSALTYEVRMGDAERLLGNADAGRRRHRRAIDQALADGNPVWAAQLLGLEGQWQLEAGHPDSMQYYWDWSRRVAAEAGIPDLTARIDQFYANYNADLGHLSLAARYHTRAIEECRRLGGGFHELRFVAGAMRFYADLGCWSAVERLWPRARILLADWRDRDLHDFDSYALRADQLRARLLTARGDVEQADRLFARILRDADSHGWTVVERAFLHQEWGTGLLEHASAERAIPVLEKGQALARERLLSVYEARAAVALADAHARRGDPVASRASLDEFLAVTGRVGEQLPVDWLRYDVVSILLASAMHSEPTGLAVARALRRLDEFIARADPSPHGYLFLQNYDRLRLLIHDLVADDPGLGYLFELTWRALPSRFGRGSPAPRELPPAGDDVGAAVRAWIERYGGDRPLRDVQRYLQARPGGAHCLYTLDGDRVLRWTVTADALRRDTLPEHGTGLEADVTTVLSHIEAQVETAGADTDAALLALLRDLGQRLLPREVFGSGGPREATFLFSPEGQLRNLPFEVLDTSADGAYQPLLARSDVAYLRFVRAAPEPSLASASGSAEQRTDALGVEAQTASQRVTGDGWLVLGAQPQSSNNRRWPLPRLEGGAREMLAVQQAFAGAKVLVGPDATKSSLTREWEDASMIHIAAHVVRDPDVPYMTYLPLTASPQGRLEDAYIDIADVRAADLRRCDLVTLSTCGSGACYVEGPQTAPSLGDAFLDAGSRTVVQTFWMVEDERASLMMVDFVERLGRGQDPIAALSQTRRAFRERSPGGNGSFQWASYSIQLSSLAPSTHVGIAR